jgi:hypothetical protein
VSAEEDFFRVLRDPQHHKVVVVGAGISIATTQSARVASWPGLLQHGVEYCAEYVQDLPKNWKTRQLQAIEDNELIEVASAISKRLRGPSAGVFYDWLSKSVGELKVTNNRLIRALANWNIPIATTNYDTLIEQTTSKSSITWQQRQYCDKFARNNSNAVLHLHGVWEQPGSVIFSSRSYDEIEGDEYFQDLIRAIFLLKTVIFVGCGDGLSDPNFTQLLGWCRRVRRESPYPAFRLVADSEKDAATRQHDPADRILLVSYGKAHSELCHFLEKSVIQTAAETVGPEQSERIIDTRKLEAAKRSLFEQRSQIEPSKFVQDAFGIAEEYLSAGATQHAWMLMQSALQHAKSHLTGHDRMRYGIRLATVMFDGDAGEIAVNELHSLLPDIATSEVDAVREYWSIYSRCLNQACYYDDALSALDKAIELTQDANQRTELEAIRLETQFLQGDELMLLPKTGVEA